MRRGTLESSVSFGYRKSSEKRVGGGEGSVKIFRPNSLVSKCRKFSERNPCRLCFRNFPVAKKFMDKREGKYQDFFEKFFFHSAEKTRRGTH